MKRTKQFGFGKEIPPLQNHVTVWFLQKESTENIAQAFFKHYSSLKWRNLKGEVIKDWKVHAWEWIWNRPI